MKLYLILIFLGFLTFVTAQKAEAHVLATDNNIGAILHIDPNDDPVAGQQAAFFFEFLDKQNKFQPKNCDCTFLIAENGLQIYSQPLFKNNPNPSLNQASVFYTFPKIDVYQIQVVGKPLTPNGFQPFTLTWNWRVDQQTNNQTPQNNGNSLTDLIARFAGGIIFLVLAFAIYIMFLRKKPNEKKTDEKTDRDSMKNTY